MQPPQNVADAYNKTAANYVLKYGDELKGKHLDRLLLQAFAMSNRHKGRMIDLGCGPGQTTRYLADCTVTDLLGTDLSEEMVKVAGGTHEDISFEVADMLALPYSDGAFGSAVAFYAIVHFDDEQLALAFKEIHRILEPGGELLFSFHIGEGTVHMDTFLEQPVNLDFFFHDLDTIERQVTEAGFDIVDLIQRRPYPNAEHPTQRAYVWVRKA